MAFIWRESGGAALGKRLSQGMRQRALPPMQAFPGRRLHSLILPERK